MGIGDVCWTGQNYPRGRAVKLLGVTLGARLSEDASVAVGVNVLGPGS
jgi:hypothetical protein